MHLSRSNSSFPSALWVLFAFLLASATAFIDLTTKHTDLGPLRVQLDYDLAKYGVENRRGPRPRAQPRPTAVRSFGKGATRTSANAQPTESYDPTQIVFSTRLNFTNPVDTITDEQLHTMLLSAYREFEINAEKYRVSAGSKPRAMTIMAFDHEVLISTSMKGDSFTMGYPATPVSEMLKQSAKNFKSTHPQVTGRDGDRHNSGGNCGEMATAHQFFLSRNPPLSSRDKDRGIELFKRQHAREVTLYKHDDGKLALIPPCATKEQDKWGCDQFVKDYNIDYLSKKTGKKNFKLPSLAGGLRPGYPKQQSLFQPSLQKNFPSTRSSSHTTLRTSTHKTSTHKTSTHKTATHKTATHKTATHKTATHKTATHKTATHKTATHKTTFKTSIYKNSTPKKTSTRKNSTPKKTSTPKKKN